MTIVPALSALRHTQDTRIFQDLSVPAILSAVLSEALGAHDRAIDASALDAASFLPRDFCVQYKESHFDFVHRLMEEEGIGYYFDFDRAEHEVLVLFDANGELPRATANGGTIPYVARGEDAGLEEWIGELAPSVAITPRHVVVRDHDWTRGMAKIEAAHGGDVRERYEHGYAQTITITEDQELLATLVTMVQQALIPPGIAMEVVGKVRELGAGIIPNFTREDAARRARIRAELVSRDRLTLDGLGHVIGFAAGTVFDLSGHPTLDGRYYVAEIVHSRPVPDGRTDRTEYVNRFRCLPIATPWRPMRVTEKPRIYGVQTATVAGPIGSDVHTDQHGRIRARFHWDRAPDDPSGAYSCWLRVSQAWAGAGSPSFLFIPRVGMEVIVTFVDGDPDRPLITGCVHNGVNPTPFMLPLQATRSVIRTRTVPHGQGYNELAFEDAMGMEKIYIRAERDLEEHVHHSHRTRVEVDQINDVNRDRFQSVGQHSESSVGGDARTFVHGDDVSRVFGSAHRIVQGASFENVRGGAMTTVEKGSQLLSALEGDVVVHAKRRVVLNQDDKSYVVVGAGDDAKGVYIGSDDAIKVEAGSAKIAVNEDGALVLSVGESKITIADGRIELAVGGSKVLVTPAAVQANKETMPA